MRQPEDIVWNTITDSAKTRFDYDQFRKGLPERWNDKVAENMLFQTIVGYVEGLSNEAIASNLSDDLLLLGLSFETKDLAAFLSDKKQVFDVEIQATKHALSLFEQGQNASEVLIPTSNLLSSKI